MHFLPLPRRNSLENDRSLKERCGMAKELTGTVLYIRDESGKRDHEIYLTSGQKSRKNVEKENKRIQNDFCFVKCRDDGISFR